MIKWLAPVLLVLLVLSGCYSGTKLRKREVPTPVVERFTQLYPLALRVKWYKSARKAFEAQYVNDDLQGRSIFREDGKWIETYTELDTADIPYEVRDAAAKKYPDRAIIESARIFNAYGRNIYSVELYKTDSTGKAQGEETIVRFAADGTFMKEVRENIRFKGSIIRE